MHTRFFAAASVAVMTFGVVVGSAQQQAPPAGTAAAGGRGRGAYVPIGVPEKIRARCSRLSQQA